MRGCVAGLLLFSLAAEAAAYAPACARVGRSSSAVMMAKKKKKAAAAKTVEVVLSAPVKGLGKKGDLVSVKPAYAENALVRAGLGVLATPEMLTQLAAEQAVADADAAKVKQQAVDDAATLEKVFKDGCVVKKKVGPDGSIFGSVTGAEVAALLQEQAGVTVDKKKIEVCAAALALLSPHFSLILTRTRPPYPPSSGRCLLSPRLARVSPRSHCTRPSNRS